MTKVCLLIVTTFFSASILASPVNSFSSLWNTASKNIVSNKGSFLMVYGGKDISKTNTAEGFPINILDNEVTALG